MNVPEATLNWLLAKDNQPVRLLTQTDLLGLSKTSTEVKKSRAQLMDYSVTQKILKQGKQFWHDDDKAYWKYTGKYWQVIFLGQFLADGHDPAIQEGLEQLLTDRGWISKTGGQCLTANILAAFMRLGYQDHPVIQTETQTLAKRIVDDGGIACHEMTYSLLNHCYISTAKLLSCFALIPKKDRAKSVKQAIALLTKQLIDHEVFVYVPEHRTEWNKVLTHAPKRKDLAKGQTVKAWIAEQRENFLATKGLGEFQAKRSWLKFGFPLHYNSNTLEAMFALAKLDTPMCNKLEKPLEAIVEKAAADKRWVMENSLNSKMLVDVEKKGAPSKWLTYFALSTIKHFDSLRFV